MHMFVAVVVLWRCVRVLGCLLLLCTKETLRADPRGVSPDTWRLDKECRWKGARSKLDRNEPNVRKKKREDKNYSVLWQQ